MPVFYGGMEAGVLTLKWVGEEPEASAWPLRWQEPTSALASDLGGRLAFGILWDNLTVGWVSRPVRIVWDGPGDPSYVG